MKLRPALTVSAFLVAACGGGPTEPPAPQVASVVVTPSSSTIDAPGATVQLSAQAKDANGGNLTGLTVTWSTSDAAVATVSSNGLVTGVTAGTAAVTATAGGVAGSAVITVKEATCDAATTVDLAPGAFRSFASGECLLLPTGAAGSRYRVVVLRTDSAAASSVADATLKVAGIGVTQAPAPVVEPASARSLAPIRGLDLAAVRRSVTMAEATSRFHMELREADAELMAEALAAGRRLAPSRRTTHTLLRANATSPEKIQIDPTTPSTCSAAGGTKVTGILVHENDDVAVYQDSTQRATNPITVGQAQRMTQYYSAYGKAMVRDYFGAMPDVDGNGKIVVFASPVASGNVAAFVWSGDFFPTESCPASNHMELVFFNSELIRQMDNETPNWQSLETLAHEAKHLISLYNRIAASIAANAGRFHPSWIEEGRAEISAEMSSRLAWAATGGPAVGTRVTRQDFVNSQITKENYGVLLRMARTIWYLSSQPNGIVVSPTGAGEGHSVYGTGWKFHRWLGDAYGSASSARADSSIFRALVDSTAAQGTNGLRAVTGKEFRTLLEEFAAAVSLFGTGAPQPQRPLTTYDYITATDILQDQPVGTYPWPVTGTGASPSKSFASGQYSGKIGPTGMRIHDFVSNGTGTGAQISLTIDVPARMVVTRIR